MPLIPHRFLTRVAHPCKYVKKLPLNDDERLIDLPESCRLENYAAMDGATNFADVRVAWNAFGLGIQATVRGKDEPPRGNANHPRSSDGLAVWVDTRDARAGHRASRTCHQFHVLPVGGGTELDEPAFVQSKVHRALQDAPLAADGSVPFRGGPVKGGWRVELFLPAAALAGFDPDEHPRLGFFYAVRDAELGEQTLSVGSDFPYAEDPSLWDVLELVK